MLHRTSSFSRSLLFIHVVVTLTVTEGGKRFGGPFRSPNRTHSQHLPVVCKDGWTAALAENLDGGESSHICIKINTQSLTWEQSRDSCRANQAFLLKLDKRVKVGTLTLDQFVQKEQLTTFWTGLHEDESKLVWDEYRQSLVQAYVGPHAGYGKIKRGWRWNRNSFSHVDDTCGLISLNRTHSRRVRSTKDFDDLMQSRHGVDLDLPDSAPAGFRLPPNIQPNFQPNPQLGYQPTHQPSLRPGLQVFQTQQPNSGEKPSVDSSQAQDPRKLVQTAVTDAPDPLMPVVTDAPDPLLPVTDSSEDENGKEVFVVKRSTMTRVVVTTPPMSSEEDQDSQETTIAPGEYETTTTTSTTTTASTSTTSGSDVATSSPRTTTTSSSTSTTATTTTTEPTTVSTTVTTMSTQTTSNPTTRVGETSTTTSTTQTTSNPTSTSESLTTKTTTTTTVSPTTVLISMQKNKVTRKENIVVTPSSIGTSKLTSPAETPTTEPTTVTTSKSPTENPTTSTARTTTTKPSIRKSSIRTSIRKSSTSTPPPTTTSADDFFRVPHVDKGGLVPPRSHRISGVTSNTVPGESIQYMNLDSCDSFHASVCYTDPVESLQQVSFCGHGWYGHPKVDKCYKVLTFPQSHTSAKRQCVLDGGTLASVDSDFYGNVTAMMYTQYRNVNRHVPPQAWVDVLTNSKIRLGGGCPILNNNVIEQHNCRALLFSVCEKGALLRSFGNLISPSLLHDKEIIRMSSSRLRSLVCPISTSKPEEQVLWFKDGVLIQDSTNVRAHPRFSSTATQQRAKSLYLNMTLLRRLGATIGGNNVVHSSLLQGKYWCEIWRLSPFKKIKSPKYVVLFTDVITLHGTLQTRGIPVNTSVIFNYMNRAVDVPANVARDLNIISSNVTRSMRMADPVLRDIASYVDHVNSDTGVIDFFIHLSLARDISERHKERVVSLYMSTLHSLLMPLSRELAPHWNLSLPVTKAITLTRTDFCPAAYLEDENTGYGAQFPKSPIGQNVDSLENCDGVSLGYAYCRGDYETGAYWDGVQVDTDCHKPLASELPVTDSDDVVHNLKPNSTDPVGLQVPRMQPFNLNPANGLEQLDEIEIEDGNVMDVMDKMAEIVDKSSDLTDADIDACAKVLSRIVEVTPPAKKIGHQLINTVNRILDADVAAITSAQLKTRAATRILNNLERFSMKTEIGTDKSIRLVTPNVALEVWNLEPGMAPVIGLGAKVGGSWTYPLTDPRILTIRDRSDNMLAGFDVAIELPQRLVMETMKENENTTRLSMLIYRKTGLFSPVSNSSLGKVNSAVISATLGEKPITGLQEMVRMAFRPFEDTEYHLKRTKCAYWDFTLNQAMGGWSSTGCHYNGTMYGLDICMCDHLTNFAVLLDFYGHSKPIDPSHELSLSIISLIGLSLSIFGLALTIITFIFFKKLRQGRAQQTLFHMALALLCSKVVFLVGIKQTGNEYFCLTVAVLLHYFILVSFLWMLIEAILQYLTFVKILGTYVSRYALKTIIPAWGLPLIPVTCVLAIDYNMYRGRESYCWMGMEAFYYAFALPVGTIVVFNIVMFIIILISLIRRPDGLRSTQSKQRRAKMHLKAGVTIFMLLGLTWIFGFLQIEDARIVFQYIFTFLSSLQGFFIFILLVVRRKQVREQWLILCCNKQEGRRAPKQVSPTNSNSTSSNGSGGSLSLHNSSTRTLTRTLTTQVSRESFDSSMYYTPTRRPPPPPYSAF